MLENTQQVLAQMDLWEKRIELCIRPRPKWIPVTVWNWMLKTTLVQFERVKS